MVAQPHLPRVRALQGWVVIDGERLEGEVTSLCGAGGVCEAITENRLAACRIKDQLQPRSPPRRINNPLYYGLGSFGFNLIQTALRTTPWHANNQLVVHFGTHTPTPTHYYIASSSIQAPSGCPAKPALMVHALERLRLCCSIPPVRGIWDNEHNTHQTHFTSLCPGLPQKNPLPKNRLVLTKP